MKKKLKNVIYTNGFVPALVKLADQPLAVTKAWTLAKFIKEVEEKNKIFDGLRIKMLEKYGKKNKEGNYEIPKENVETVNKEFDLLLNMEEEYEIEPLKLDDDIKLSTKELILIEEIIIQ